MDLRAAGVCAVAAAATAPLLAAYTVRTPNQASSVGLTARRWVGGGASPRRIAGIAVAVVLAAGTVGARFGFQVVLPAYWFFAVAGVALAVIDAEQRRLPFALVIPTYVVSLVFFSVASVTSGTYSSLVRAVLAAVGTLVAFLVFALVFAGKWGLGDVVVQGSISLSLGWLGWDRVVVGAIVGLGLGAVIGLIGVGVGADDSGLGRRVRSSRFALGPALLTGWLFAALL